MRYISLCFASLLCYVTLISSSLAASITCNVSNAYSSDWSAIDTPFELNVTQVNAAKNVNITLGTNISDYTVLYTIPRVNISNVSASCSAGTGLYYTMFSSNYGPAVRTTGSETIYPTSVSGIGISIGSNNQSDSPITLYPNVKYWGGAGNGLGFWLSVKIWKIPGTLPTTTGAISFTGPTLGQLLMSSGNTFTSSDASRLWDNNKGWIASSRVLKGTLMFQPTTCDLVMPSRTVNMGTFDGAGGQSAWKDASFKLNCPNAYGYGGSTTSENSYDNPNNVRPNSTITANTIKNNPIRIQIVPRTTPVDINNGIIALDGSGAQGYGIQLAWGDSNVLGSGAPGNPVILNNWALAHSLNSAYSNTAYTIGASAISSSADGTIKMAARYVRTTGPTQAGPANAAVEVIASYQ